MEFLWGFVLGLSHLSAFVVGAVVGAAAIVSAIHGLRLFPIKVQPRIPTEAPHLKRKETEEERLAKFEAAWINPDFTAEDYLGRGPVKRVNPTRDTREAGSSSAFQKPVGLAGVAKRGAAVPGGAGPSPSQ